MATSEGGKRKYAKDEIVFIRCRVMNYDFDTGAVVQLEKGTASVDTPDNGEYVLETVDRHGNPDQASRVIWIKDSHLVSLEEAKRALRK